jgi:hypothetical protein
VHDELDPGRVRASWTLPGAVLGLLAAAIGWWLVHSVARAHMFCDVFGGASIPGIGQPALACGGVNARHTSGVVLVVCGALLALAALFVAGRRGRAADRQGQPWPLRRCLTRVAASVDRRLPGASDKRSPRIDAGAVGAVVSCLLLVGLVAAHGAWSSHERATELAHRHAAEQRLATLTLPKALASASSGPGCSPSADMLCASSAMSAEALRPVMESLLSGRSSTGLCGGLTQPGGMPCPVTVYGKIAGYPSVAIVFPHLIDVRDGKPPARAVPIRPGSHRAYFLGSDVNVSLIVPMS